jgi:hypothetical protein
VGEIPTLTELAHLYGSISQYELLNTTETFRLRYLWTPSRLYLLQKQVPINDQQGLTAGSKWLAKRFFLRATYTKELNNGDHDQMGFNFA